ncbi:thiolase family protein [Nakamurella antarctica]|uniref:Thiolase family protein n=1 Tax=Nakamurella antarctica TaxID=1902245 RepID=A0A3G8ZJA6_9ACTN|nr:thiolase family protein [Nakamurella antarctica]AZI57300.1 thiolase family protein [Nakamurella antarctica]
MATSNRARPVIVAARRSPIGTAGHSLATLRVDQLAAPILRAVAADAAFLGLAVDDVVLGNCLGPGGNLGRITALAADLGDAVPGVTVDRQCGSGLDAIMQGASRIAGGDAELIVAGGAESASTAPHRYWPAAPATAEHPATPKTRYTRAPFAPVGYPDPEMGPAAEALAVALGISRERQDEWAVRSHERAVRSQQHGVFDAEMVTVGRLSRDERPRSGMTTQRLARLPGAFMPGLSATGTVTAGNSCGISDGAAAVALTSFDHWATGGTPGLQVVGSAVSGCDPALPGLGPIGAIRKLLQRHRLHTNDIGAIEITEAFAAQIIAVVDELGLEENLVCSDGGAIAMGHPWGASGAILMVRLFSRMVRVDGPELGLAACAIGGGQGIAVLVKKVHQ